VRRRTRSTTYFIEGAFPTREEAKTVIDVLEDEREGLSVNDIMTRINLTKGRIQKTLDLISLESPPPLIKLGTRWQLTSAKLSEAFWQRAKRLTDLRRAEQKQMQDYVRLHSNHMDFLIRALDGDIQDLVEPNLPLLSTVPAPALVREAIQFLRRFSLPVEPRLTWPAGGMPAYRGEREDCASSLSFTWQSALHLA
jgi:ATP-dependent DNA helicase RecQ